MVATMITCVVMGVVLEAVGILLLIARAKNDTFGAVILFMGVILVLIACGMVVMLITGMAGETA